jgi:hypothetical protein
LPDTNGAYALAQYATSQFELPSVPSHQHLPKQEPGRRPQVP